MKNGNVSSKPYARSYNWFQVGTRHQKFVVNLWKVQLVARGWKNSGKSCNTGPVRLFDVREKSVDIVKTHPNKLEYVSRR